MSRLKISLAEVRRLYAERTGRVSIGRHAVWRWLRRQDLIGSGGCRRGARNARLDREAVVKAMDACFPVEVDFISVATAFQQAGLPYPRRSDCRE